MFMPVSGEIMVMGYFTLFESTITIVGYLYANQGFSAIANNKVNRFIEKSSCIFRWIVIIITEPG